MAKGFAIGGSRASSLCRFNTQEGTEIINESGLCEWSRGWNSLPKPEDFDTAHAGMRSAVIETSNRVFKRTVNKFRSVNSNIPVVEFSHGVAAKMINCYLKALYVLGLIPFEEAEQDRRDAIHPPIDRLLLNGLIENKHNNQLVADRIDIWRYYRKKAWSKFDSADYEKVISEVRSVTQGQMWKIEAYWPLG